MTRGESILFDQLEYDNFSPSLRSYFLQNEFKSVVFLTFQSEKGSNHYLVWFTRVWQDDSMVFTQLLSSFHHSLHSFYKRVHLYNQLIEANTYNQDVLHTMLIGIVIFDESGVVKHLNSEGSRVLNQSMSIVGQSMDSLSLEPALHSFFEICV